MRALEAGAESLHGVSLTPAFAANPNGVRYLKLLVLERGTTVLEDKQI